MQPALSAVADLPRVIISDAQLIELRNGRPIKMPPSATVADEWAAVLPNGQLAAILRAKHFDELWPVHNLG
jgi:hypothetical protein